MAHEVHPKKIVDCKQFGKEGKIYMEMPDNYRTTALSNSIFEYVMTDEELLTYNSIEDPKKKEDYLKVKTLRKSMTATQLSVLAYVTDAPFHLNDYSIQPTLDYKSFMDFITVEIFKAMVEKMKELGTIDPLSL